ncbi:MAG TPA: glycosyltransferase family 2 protein, partial [Geoalkalibacter subterraneus]|nr:glycosyltransferase family 2 protein [Geoalkalibacter subterraneus]
MTPAAVIKYQRRRAVVGPWALSGNHGRSFDGVVVIPALAEEQSLPETLKSLGDNPARWRDKFLVVVVVNNRCDAPQPWREQNRHTLTLLEETGGSGFGLNLAWVDASSAGFELPDGEGVGLARKIGFDLAMQRLDWRGDPLCASLDADTLTDGNYFEALKAHFCRCTSAGAVVPFRHRRGATLELDEAITHYELYLRHYVLGLELARSPYAYHTIGSALACRALA